MARLSDFLFMAARMAAHRAGCADRIYKKHEKTNDDDT